MVLNQLLWSVAMKNAEGAKDFPSSAKALLEQFEVIINEYNTIRDFIDASTGIPNPSLGDKAHGLYVEAFCNGLSAVLLDFNKTLLEIEESSFSESSVSVLNILDKLGSYTNVLQSLNFAVRQVKEEKFRGCKILDLCENLIITFPHTHEYVFRKIQQHCLKQFYKQIKLWIIQGLLRDPYGEFFIIPAEKITSSYHSICSIGTVISQPNNSTGSPMFQVNSENLPDMIPASVATKIHFIGEALAACHHNEAESRSNDKILSMCGINEQNIASQLAEIEESEYFSLKKFSSLIDDLWIGVNKYIRQICDEIGCVETQLELMWEVFLLGRGELFQEFLLKATPFLNADVGMVSVRNLNNIFKDAVYYVYLTDYSELTDNFFFKLPDKKIVKQGYTTWSVLQMKYKVKWPLHNLFTRDVMRSYNKMFVFLLKLKNAQTNVTATWKDINSIKDHSLRMELTEIRMHLLAVVGNLQNYCFTNVIASEMITLRESVKNTVMFTDLQEALNIFLANISNRLFFPDTSFTRCSTFDRNVESLETVFLNIFSLCKSFSELNEKTHGNIMVELLSLKKKMQSFYKKLFSLLNKIEQNYCYDGGKSSSHLFNLMMCLDYNRFFRSKFNISLFD